MRRKNEQENEINADFYSDFIKFNLETISNLKNQSFIFEEYEKWKEKRGRTITNKKTSLIMLLMTFVLGLLFFGCEKTIYLYKEPIEYDVNNPIIYNWQWVANEGNNFIIYNYAENLTSSLLKKTIYYDAILPNIKLEDAEKETIDYIDAKLTDIIRENGKIQSFKIKGMKFVVKKSNKEE
jgi:hypothetical protein